MSDNRLKFLDVIAKIENKTKIVRLTEEFVEIQTPETDTVNETGIADGIHMGAFSNSVSGRDIVGSLDIPQDIKDRILSAWGDTPTVEEPAFEQKTENE